MNRSVVAPLCGVAAAILLVVTFILTGFGEDPSSKSAQEIVQHWKDNDTQNIVGVILMAISAVLLLFYAGWLRGFLRSPERPDDDLPNVAFAALTVLSAGLAVAATLHLALVDTVGDVDPVVTNTLNAIDYDFFIPFVVGMAGLLIATGVSTLRGAALPRWLGWVTIVLAVVMFTPAGPIAFVAGLVLIATLGIIGAGRSRASTAPGTP
jgi:hypothetical protein